MLLLGALCVFFRLAIMADVDPDTLLEWLQMGQGDERDMQLIALEQLCMLLLMSDNVDRCFETWVLILNDEFSLEVSDWWTDRLSPVTGVLLGRSCRRSVRSSWTRALQITCWRSQPEPSPTTWTCLPSAPGGLWEWTGPSRRCATGWWWWSSTTGPAEISQSSVSRWVTGSCYRWSQWCHQRVC